MKGFVWLLAALLPGLWAGAQTVDLKEFTGMLDLGQSKLEAHLQKKGFRRALSDLGTVRFVREEASGPNYQVRGFEIISTGAAYELAYETTSADEYRALKDRLEETGFIHPEKLVDTNNVLYQHENISIQSCRRKEDTTLFYVLRASKKIAVRLKNLEAAEDLLQLNAQGEIADVFGRANVKTDWFFYDDKDSAICSVLFPNSSREAIFIWNDPVNLKDVSFIVVGGHLRNAIATAQYNATANNSWISRQGLYCGMPLQEVEQLNRQPVQFYNWRGAYAGCLAANNHGFLDFSHVSIVFGCMNCNYLKLSSDATIDSDRAREEQQKVFVTTLIIMPNRKQNDQAAHE